LIIRQQNIQPLKSSVGHGRDQCSTPLYPLARNRDWMKPSFAFGYTYDIFATTDEPQVTTAYIVPEKSTGSTDVQVLIAKAAAVEKANKLNAAHHIDVAAGATQTKVC
jgi:hypothetical protein